MTTGNWALVVAGLSLLVSGLSLGWQIASWLMSAGRVKATLHHGLLTPDFAYTREVGRDGAPAPLEGFQGQRIRGREVLGIEVINVGRAPVKVARYQVALARTGATATPLADSIGPDLPHRIEPGESATWYVEMDSVRGLVYAGQVIQKGAREVYMTAELATRKEHRTKTSLKV